MEKTTGRSCAACNMIANGVKSRIALPHTCGLKPDDVRALSMDFNITFTERNYKGYNGKTICEITGKIGDARYIYSFLTDGMSERDLSISKQYARKKITEQLSKMLNNG